LRPFCADDSSLKSQALAYIEQMRKNTELRRLLVCVLLVCVTACGSLPSPSQSSSVSSIRREKANDVVIYALGLIETGYQFGGKNPEAGLDCSGMVSHVFKSAAGASVKGSAADIARQGRPIDRSALRPGDLVFFNTTGKPFSHVGIYIGNQRFVHAPSTGGKVRTESLTSGWFSTRFQTARAYFD
jgi:cell wall-associated NlpC family hydrolase